MIDCCFRNATKSRFIQLLFFSKTAPDLFIKVLKEAFPATGINIQQKECKSPVEIKKTSPYS